MLEKISLEEFRNIKEQMTNLIEIYENSQDMEEDVFYENYINLEKQLLSYDLSDISFREWEGMTIGTGDELDILDFSKTKANIDFSLIDYVGNANFKGCNVINLQEIGIRVLNPNDFDNKTIDENPELFLTSTYSKEFNEKYYNDELDIDDITSISEEQLTQLIRKDGLVSHMEKGVFSPHMIETIGFERLVQLYKYSKEEYEAIEKTFKIIPLYNFDSEILIKFKNCDISEIKNNGFDLLKKYYLTKRHIITGPEDIEQFPKQFVEENKRLFLLDVDLPEDVRKRFLNRKMTIRDYVEHNNIFKDIPIGAFVDYKKFESIIHQGYEIERIQKMIDQHPGLFLHLEETNLFYSLQQYLDINGMEANFEQEFEKAITRLFLEHGINNIDFRITANGEMVYNIPEWLKSMDYKFLDKIRTEEELFNITNKTIIIDEKQRRVIELFNIENIRKLEQETGFFTHQAHGYSKQLEMFEAMANYLQNENNRSLESKKIDFNNGNLAYEEFLKMFARCLYDMKSKNYFSDYPDYSWITGSFRNEHPEIFISENAPDNLKNAFYKNRIYIKTLSENKESLNYLYDKNLSEIIRDKIHIDQIGLVDILGNGIAERKDFISEYATRYGNEKLLNLLAKYGYVLKDITISGIHNEISDEQEIEKAIRKAIYDKIKKGNDNYAYLAEVPEFIQEHPDIFMDFKQLTSVTEEQREDLEKRFYTRKLTFEDIRQHKELVEMLKNKDLSVIFGINLSNYQEIKKIGGNLQTKSYEVISGLGNEKILELCAEYGKYMKCIYKYNDVISIRNMNRFSIFEQSETEFDELKKQIEKAIGKECLLGNIEYTKEEAPDFLKEQHPELFLADDAPAELIECFYGTNKMDFMVLNNHKEWLPYLQDKSITTSLLRNSHIKNKLINYFNVFGHDKAMKLGLNRAETVTEMLNADKIDVMKQWYDKTGGKFIPDFVVMQNFSIEEADKFLTSASNWSNLMRIKRFSEAQESRDAMLKLAYSFGAFDQDQRGFKKLQDMLIGLPKKLLAENSNIINDISDVFRIFETINDISLIESINNSDNLGEFLMTKEEIIDFFSALKKENVSIDYSKNIFRQIYRQNEDGSYTLTINEQNCPKTAEHIRGILEKYHDAPVISPHKAHQLFGGFELKYDPDFREFLLANIDKVVNNPEKASYISKIQKQFGDIKTINSNRTLTWDLAVSYVQVNRFENINPGNERAAEISSIAGYSQNDFDTLQKIYNYGKQRTYSSIPRIKNTSGNYTYEILRLDDPLAMSIGTLTDCCQELGDCAELCMEHSMVDKNGRVFIIKDEEDNIVAQSWVWRNKDVLCFDNVEIPAKAFTRNEKSNGNSLAIEVFDIYKQAAQDLIEEDEKVYKELLESGKITEEQYNGLRLGKVTVGLGYNDIAHTLKEKASIDTGVISRPLPFEAPVKLHRGLYTSDSNTQYILEEREDRQEYDGLTLTVHNDQYEEYDNKTLTTKELITLKKLEKITKDNPRFLETDVDEYVEEGDYVSEIARNYDLNPNATRIILHPNFAIIYESKEDKVIIGDLLYNTEVNNGQQQINIEEPVTLQIRLALEQISEDKEVDIKHLDEKQQAMYQKAIGLNEEIDIERGISHAR